MKKDTTLLRTIGRQLSVHQAVLIAHQQKVLSIPQLIISTVQQTPVPPTKNQKSIHLLVLQDIEVSEYCFSISFFVVKTVSVLYSFYKCVCALAQFQTIHVMAYVQIGKTLVWVSLAHVLLPNKHETLVTTFCVL